jgi:Tfp pilus assembly PilM family ATPase
MPTWLGIDIGSTSVKVAVVRSAYRKISLVALASADVSASGGVVPAVRDAFAKALIDEKQVLDAVATAVDGGRAAIHRLVLPATAQKQLGDVLGYELEAQVPFDLDTAVFDWKPLDRVDAAGQISIVAAVARLEDVRARIDAIKEAIGQEPERVGVGALTLGALLPYMGLDGDATVAVVDLGSKASEVLVLERGEAVFARTLSTGTDGLPATASRLARDIRVSFAAHRMQGGEAPTRVYLCGGGAFVSGAEGFLFGELEIPVQLIPAPALDMTSLAPTLLSEMPKYTKAVALALSLAGRGSGMNLRRGPLAFERGFSWVRERIPLLAGLAAVILVSFVFSGWARLHAVHSERDALIGALGTVTQDVLGSQASSAQEAQDLLAKEVALTDEDPMPHADAFDVMVRLSQAVPSSMVHDVEELEMQRGHVVVRGIVGSIPDAQSIASSLSEQPCFSDVKIKNTTQAVGSDRQKYVMELDVKCPEDVKSLPKKKGDTSNASAASSGSK